MPVDCLCFGVMKKMYLTFETFLRSLRRYFRVNAASYAVDPDDILKISSIGNCFPLDSVARIWFDDVEDSLASYDDFEESIRTEFAAGSENIVQLQHSWEQARQGRHSVREFYAYLAKLRMRIAAIDADEKPSDRELLRKFCGNLSDPARTVIAKKRITDPNLELPALVKLAELEDSKKFGKVSTATASLRALNFRKREEKPRSNAKYCFYCGPEKGRGHTPEECRRIAARKAAGTWKENPETKK
jgi:arsenate reductase-like glutaredoxin family protein